MDYSKGQASTKHCDGSELRMSPADLLFVMDVANTIRTDQSGYYNVPPPPTANHDGRPLCVRPQDVLLSPRVSGFARSSSRQPPTSSPSPLTSQPSAISPRAAPLGRPLTPQPSACTERPQVATPSLPASRSSRHPVALPDDADPHFKIEIRVQGHIGLRMTLDRIMVDTPLNQTIVCKVDGADVVMDNEIRGKEVWTQRAHFPGDSSRATPRRSPKDPKSGFTVGHLLTILVKKQYIHWNNFEPTRKGFVELRDLIGPAAGSMKHVRVHWESEYAVAIRRRRIKEGIWCYFLELEIRIG
ncbi:hypothetical protein BN946_scf184850.g11 [Trametes cinnabarina]|uniref:Uncharacterized protein n=1 Tax=Pycnoporus cinnabarinus TaxID=5643 RepID=A0A060SQ66_PYCCI|nr:hypothetical protein BN946_scf184850.g11 [Trametes cinnabarina]